MTGRFRHGPAEPLNLVCRMVERTGAKRGASLCGFASDRKYSLFKACPGEWTLRGQPLSPAERVAVPELRPAPTRRELAVSEARLLLEQVGFVSGLQGRVER
jgi:hypothetical protein